MFEGIGKYIFGLFVIYLISYFVKKRELSKIFKKANKKPSTAYVPFKCTKELINISHSNPKYFSLTLIPFANIYANIAIYKDMLTTFGRDPKEAPFYFLMPMVYFTKLGSGASKIQVHDYDLNNEYLQAQSMLYEPVIGVPEEPLYEMTDPGYYVPDKPKEKIVYRVARRNKNSTNESIKIMTPSNNQMPQNQNAFNSGIPELTSVPEIKDNVPVTQPPSEAIEIMPGVAKPETINQGTILDIPAQNTWQAQPQNIQISGAPVQNDVVNPTPTSSPLINEGPRSVFTDNSLEPDKRQESIVVVQKKEEVLKNPIKENIKGRPQMCPKCGAKLAPGAKVCFLCGTHLQ